MNDPKPWYASKTIWFNTIYFGVAILLTVANAFGYADFVPDADVEQGTGILTELIVAVIPLVGNVLIRLRTSQPIG